MVKKEISWIVVLLLARRLGFEQAQEPSLADNPIIRNLKCVLALKNAATGFLNDCRGPLRQARKLGIKGTNGIYTETDRQKMMEEIRSFKDDCDLILKMASYNGSPLFCGAERNYETFTISYGEGEEPETITLEAIPPRAVESPETYPQAVMRQYSTLIKDICALADTGASA